MPDPQEVCNFTGADVSGFNVSITEGGSINTNISFEPACLDISGEASCIENLTSFALLTPRTQPLEPSTATVVSVSVVFVVFFAVPLAVLWVVVSRKLRHDAIYKKKQEKHEEADLQQLVAKKTELSFLRLSYKVKIKNPSKRPNGEEENSNDKALDSTTETTNKYNTKTILNRLTGTFEPSTLTAIMGPSGCGKSTLLDILADRKHDGIITGDVFVNGAPRDTQFKLDAAYVMQSDALFPYLTVREHLRYAAELRLPGNDLLKINTSVDRVIKDLDLEKVADTRVGNETIRGISGGQARRVTVGLELITKPSLLFLDEPTTGLDAYSSLTLVKVLRKLTDSGRTLICTIHQPRPDIFMMFDKLLLMKAGQLAYFGAVDQIESHFATVGLPVPEGVNPADFVVDLTYTKEDKQDISAVDVLIQKYLKSDAHLADLNKMKGMQRNVSRSSHRRSERTQYRQSIFTQTYILLRRSYKNIFRNRTAFITVFLQSSQFLFYGFLYFDLQNNVEQDGFGYSFATTPAARVVEFPTSTNLRFLSFSRALLFQVMTTMTIVESVVIPTAFLEKKIFRREHAAGSYSHVAYHLQWGIRFYVDAVWKAGIATIFAYFLPQWENLNASRVFFFFAVMAVTSTLGSSLAFLMVSLIPDAEGADNIHHTVIGFMGLYSGFFLPQLLIPVFFIWAYYISFSKYGFEALVWNQFDQCTETEIQQFFQLDMNFNRWTNLLVLMMYPLLFHLIAMLGTFIRTRPRSYWLRVCAICFTKEQDAEATAEQQSNQIEMVEKTGVEQKIEKV